MRSEELGALAGDLAPVDLGPIHNRARDEVVRKGKATGKEHGVAVLGDGTMVSFGGDYENRIEIPRCDAPEGSVTIHHNHPSGDSFSRADLRVLLERSEIGRVDAHGHHGGWSSIKRIGGPVSPTSALILVEEAMSQAQSMTRKATIRNTISAEAGQSGLWQVVMSLLLEGQGVIHYALNSDSVLDSRFAHFEGCFPG